LGLRAFVFRNSQAPLVPIIAMILGGRPPGLVRIGNDPVSNDKILKIISFFPDQTQQLKIFSIFPFGICHIFQTRIEKILKGGACALLIFGTVRLG
jgi:hypothetical protein